VLTKNDGQDSGRCAIPSTGTATLVAHPTAEIYEEYKVDCNKAYYRYAGYRDCDDTLADSFSPVHIFDAGNEDTLIALNQAYVDTMSKAVRDTGVRAENADYKEFVELLETK